MHMSLKTLGRLLALAIFVVAVLMWITPVIRNRYLNPTEQAGPLIEPVMRNILADLGWQNTGILLESGEMINIQFRAGEIRDGDTILRGLAGTGYICGGSTCCEPMPHVQRGALIGRVQNHLFLIGDQNTIQVQETGELQLRVNDCDSGLFDNTGSFQVKISH